MSGFPVPGYGLMIVDDDEMAREVLALLAARAGFTVEGFGSGAEALERLAAGGDLPRGVLADMQMPGPSGETFARLARMACADGTVVLAMSATEVAAEQLHGYDGFLRKPFGMKQMCAALERGAGSAAASEKVEAAVVLKMASFEQLSRAMKPEQLRELYRVFLADAEVRTGALQAAAAARDEEGWRRAAHQLKGSCGVVGASELAGLAGEMEVRGLPGSSEKAPFAEMVAAMSRLRRILEAELP